MTERIELPATIDRTSIERLLERASAPIPADLQPAFLRYQYTQQVRFLGLINLLGQLAYFSYVLADAIVIPDVLDLSLAIRSGLLLLTLPIVLALFRRSRDVALLDMVLPSLILLASIGWNLLLLRSQSPAVASYQYASVIFIVLANLCVRVRFVPALVLSLLIAAVTMVGSVTFSHGQAQAVIVFALVYLPVLLFSLFISWSNTLAGRRAFLHAVLEEQGRRALAEAAAQLEALAATDALTGIGNRRRFDAQAQRFWNAYQKSGQPFAVLLADIDHFKHYNDHYGHPAGDACLVQVAQALNTALRQGEHTVCRYGGEEFAVLVAAATPAVMAQIAERLLLAVRQQDIAHAHRPDGLQTVSLSIGAALACQSDSLAALIQQADAQLYRAKRQGRNQTCSVSSSPPAAHTTIGVRPPSIVSTTPVM